MWGVLISILGCKRKPYTKVVQKNGISYVIRIEKYESPTELLHQWKKQMKGCPER